MSRTYHMSEEGREKYGSWNMPDKSGISGVPLSDKNLEKALNWMLNKLSDNGKFPTQQEFDTYMKQYSGIGGDEYNDVLTILKNNSDKVPGLTFNDDGSVTYNKPTTTNRDVNFYNMLNESEQAMRDSMMLSPNDEQAQQYKQDMYGSLDAYEADLDASLAASEMSAYQQIGQQQLELENMIAEQRMKALKSGTTSAQLASQGLANMFAAQSGAAQVANNLLASRQQAANQIAQSRYGITQDMYNIINANQQTYASAKAQYAATMGNYAATVNQPYAQYNAWGALSALDKERLNTSYAKGK